MLEGYVLLYSQNTIWSVALYSLGGGGHKPSPKVGMLATRDVNLQPLVGIPVKSFLFGALEMGNFYPQGPG